MEFIYFLAFWGLVGIIVGIIAIRHSNKLQQADHLTE